MSTKAAVASLPLFTNAIFADTHQRQNFVLASVPGDGRSQSGSISEANSGTCAEVSTPLSQRFQMLLANDPISLRKLAQCNRDKDLGDGPMLDGPPRGRSPIALKKQQVSESLNRTRGVHRREMKPPGRADRSTSQYRHQRRERSRSRSRMAVEGLATYPPYVSVPGLFRPRQNLPSRTKGSSHPSGRTDMIKGSTCQLIMQLLAEYQTAEKVLSMMMLLQPLAGTLWDETEYELSDGESDGGDDNGGVRVDAMMWHLGKDDVEAIMEQCGSLELTGSKELQVDVEGWGKEVIVKFWLHADTGGMEEKWRDDPINTGSEGFWTKLEKAGNRDWDRWPSPSIGPRQYRKRLEEMDWDEDF